MSSIVVNGDTSGSVTLSAPATAGTVTVTLPATSGTMAVLPAATGVLAESAGGTGTSTGCYGFKNRIINGAMVIDQRNAGASVTPTDGQYVLDRYQQLASAASKYSVQQNAGSVTPPAGFTNYLGCTSLSAYSISASDYFNIRQSIEGFNVADLGWGTANAATVTLSFWVRSSLTGTFGGSFRDNSATRSYPFSYTISAANTWEQKSITVAGDTSGTWATNNARSVLIQWSLGTGSTNSGTAGAWNSSGNLSATGATSVVGTSGATWYVTGVQLEKGSTATSFDYRPYGTELGLCQRYYEKSYNTSVVPGTSSANGYSVSPLGTNSIPNGAVYATSFFKVTKRAVPTLVIYSYVGTLAVVSAAASGSNLAANSAAANSNSDSNFSLYNNTGGAVTTDGYGVIYNWTATAEL